MISIALINESFFFSPSGSSQSARPSGSGQSGKGQRGPTKRLDDNKRFAVDEVAKNGEPLASTENVTIFVNQCGIHIRDNITVITREWHKPKVADGAVTYVDERSKELLSNTVMTHFNLPDGFTEAKKLKIKH